MINRKKNVKKSKFKKNWNEHFDLNEFIENDFASLEIKKNRFLFRWIWFLKWKTVKSKILRFQWKSMCILQMSSTLILSIKLSLKNLHNYENWSNIK